MDTKNVIAEANSQLRAHPNMLASFASAGTSSAQLLMTDDEDRSLFTIGIEMLNVLVAQNLLGEFVRTSLAVAQHEHEAGERAGRARLRQELRTLILD